MATKTSVLASPFIYATGQEVLPIGGYTGTIPEPSVGTLESMIAARQFHLVFASPKSKDPRITWIARHCVHVPTPRSSPGPGNILAIAIYYCSPRR